MIEHSELARLAAARQTAMLTMPVRPGSDARYTLAVLVLWPEPTIRSDAWRCLVLEGATRWEPAILFASVLTFPALPHDMSDAHPFAPIDVSAPVSYTDVRQLAEATSLASRDRLHVEFSYRKDGHPIEQRAGRAMGLRDGLLSIEDTARNGERRSFRLDRISAFRAVGEVPRWDGAEYRLPSDPKPWGDDPFSGHGEGEE